MLKSAPKKQKNSPLKQQKRQIHNPKKQRLGDAERLKFKQLRASLLDGSYVQRKSPSQIKREFFENRNDFGKPQLIGATHMTMPTHQAWVFNLQKERVGIADLTDNTFNARTDKTSLIHDVVRWQLAKKRSGTHKQLNRREITGTGKKPFQQKGTGRARASTLRSPIHTGGARAHAKNNRDYSFVIPRQQRRQALRIALSARKKDGRLFLIDSIEMPTFKTQEVGNILSHWHTKKALIVHGDYEQDANLMVGLRNNRSYRTLPARGANVHDLLRAPIILMSVQALHDLEARLDPLKDHRKTATFVSPVFGLKSLNQIKKEQAVAAAAVWKTPIIPTQQHLVLETQKRHTATHPHPYRPPYLIIDWV